MEWVTRRAGKVRWGRKRSCKAYFNVVDEENDDLGDLLFGDKEDFMITLGMMNPGPKKKFVEAILVSELIDKDSLWN